jgi:chromosomal replication initiator protein
MNYMMIPGLKRDFMKGFNTNSEMIINTVVAYYGIPMKELASKNRRREFVNARQIAFYLLSKHTSLTYRQIGLLFGGRDHTTVIYGIKTINKLSPLYKSISNDISILENKING